MRRSVIVQTLLLAVLLIIPFGTLYSAPDAGKPARLMRRPDINGGRIVFSYQGDLWMVSEEGGLARRLTAHEGREDYAKFSPDGKMLAFTADYNESRDALFVMPADGGEPTQLTYHPSASEAVTWTRDGKYIIFSSTRESFVRFFKQFFRVPVSGGVPEEIGIGKASFGTFSPDGKMMAYNRHPGRFWWWKRYKGSQNTDVWIYDFDKGTFKQITDYEGNDSWPMWCGDRIYYVSDRNGGIANIYSQEVASGKVKQVTSFEKHGVTWPSISSDGKKIVFEREARLYVLDTSTDQAREVVVYLPTDDRTNMISYINPLSSLSSFDISPSGKRLVFEARGEIFSAPEEHGDVRNLTESSGSRDSSPAWSPDGKWIAYVSDKSGDDEVYLVDQMGKEPEKKLTDSGHFKKGLLWSPDSKDILFTNEANELYMLDIGDGKEDLIAKNEHSDITTYDWSPDGKWIAYDFAMRNRARDIYIYDVKKQEQHQVTFDLADDTEPTFTPDGKYLLLVTQRYHGANTLARISLLPEEKEPFVHKDDEETGDSGTEDADKDDDGDNGNGKDKDSKKAKKEKVDVKIDFKDMESRIRRVPRTGGLRLNNVQATDRYYYYLIMGTRRMMFRISYDLYAFDTKKIESEKIASDIVTYGINSNNDKVAIYDGSKFHIIKVGSKMSAKKEDDDDRDTVDIRRQTSMKLDRPEEWQQIFNECWRVVKYLFYDKNTHGVNWDEVKEYYASLMPYVKTREELNILMDEMVGELNASHQGVGGGDVVATPRAPVAFLGAKMIVDKDTGLPRFEKIYKGDKLSLRENSPLDNDYVKIKEGDYLLAINGNELSPGENFYKYLVNETRNKIHIMTNSKPTMKGAVETVFMAPHYDSPLMYKDWVDGNADQVDKASGGKIGYMHLSDMSGSGWVTFREDFEKFRYKDAIIIDVRYNGGGSIDARIIDYLERRPYMYQQSRGESPIDRPDDSFTGDIVVLCNEYSYSDAEVFPAAVKERGLGTLIGVPTLGFVIAVSPHNLIDGGQIRKTFIGIWEKGTNEQLESRGAIPDIIVQSPPDKEKAGEDTQLEKAIDFLMKKIAENPRKDEYDTTIEPR